MYLSEPCCGGAAGHTVWTRLQSSAMLVLDTILNIFLEVTKALLDLADVFLDISFYLHTLVVQYHAGGFFDFTFGFFDSAFYLIFVHECLLIII